MASTYSNLKFELIGTGDQSGTWGTTTNTNLGTAIEQAIVGMATISSGFVTNSLTLTLTDTNAAQNARALVLNLTQALSGAGTLNVPAIQKPYMIINATGQTVTVKVTGQTGVAVPTGTRTFLYNNGTDVGSFFNYAASLTLGTDLAVADGGTGASSAPAARTNLGASTVGSNLFTLTNPSAITFIRINADNTVTALSAADFRTAIGAGTGGGSVTSVATSNGPAPINGLTLTGGPITSTGTVTLGGGVNVSTITTGILPVANGGTGVNAAGTSGNVLTSNGTAWVSQAGSVAANIQTFSATGTYTKPTGASFVMVEMWSAGGSGANGSARSFASPGAAGLASGGGGGAYTYRMFAAPAVGATETVTVGAGGSPGNGGTSNFGTLLYAFGGRAGGIYPYTPTSSITARGGYVTGNATTGGLRMAAPLSAPSTPALSSTTFSLTGGNAGGLSQAYIWGVWGGGDGGSHQGVADADAGKGSLFGGAGGGGGGTANVAPGPSITYRTAAAGGTGLLYGRSGNIDNFGAFGGGAAGTGQPNPAPANGANGPGNFFGGGGGAAGYVEESRPVGVGGNGGLAAGGGGGGGTVSGPQTPLGTGGAGGNGYAVVYTW